MANDADKDIRKLESELLQLDQSIRATLAKTLLASLDGLPDEEYGRLWAAEAEARYDDFLADRAPAIDGDDVFARAHARVRER